MQRYFAQRENSAGIAHLQLRVPLHGFGVKGLALEHDVRVIARRGRDDENLNDLIRISWEPEGHGPYPGFSGTLVTWAEHDPKQSFIEIDGTYTPPLGIAGEAFDKAVGHSIATRTAHLLLEDIARDISDHAA
ncbi:MAG: hypothetical protein JO092_06365 [Candidatus Eremiobacteraeota bacterium]|nr:hypothetical protein [Candidatus Eremiobacteraeota bacterium]